MHVPNEYAGARSEKGVEKIQVRKRHKGEGEGGRGDVEKMEGMEGNGREGRGKGFSQTGQVRHKRELSLVLSHHKQPPRTS